MALTVEDIDINHDMRSETTRYLLGNLFYKMKATVTLVAETLAKSGSSAPIDLGAFTTWSSTGGWIKANGSRFKDFHIGQTIHIISATVAGNNGTYTIINKQNDDYIEVNTTFSFENSTTAWIYLDRGEYNSMIFEFGQVGNNEPIDYTSKLDGEPQKFSLAGTIPASLTAMTPSGPNMSWLLGDCKVSSNNTGFQGVRFVIEHNFYIGPFFLHQQWNDVQSLTPPSWFTAGECLRYILKATTAPNLNDPNKIQVVEWSEELGNTGWFNERFNGQQNNYSISGLTFTRTSDGANLSALELATGDTTDVEFFVNNTIDSPFDNFPGGTFAVLNFIFAPSSATQYKNLVTDMGHNFRFDRAFIHVGAPAINGEQNGVSDRQALTSVSGTWISGSQIRINARFDNGAGLNSFLSGLNTKRYMLALYVQNDDLAAEVADGVTLLVDAGEFGVNIKADGLVSHDHLFIRHPHTSRVNGLIGITSHLEDEVISSNTFTIDTSTIIATSVTMAGASHIIRAKNSSTGATFELDRLDIDLTGAIINNGMTVPNFTKVISHQAPSGELITLATLLRNFSADAPPVWEMTFNYPFLVRWEYWLALLTADPSFYDSSEPNNNLNNEWDHYDDFAPWSIEAVSRINMNVDGTVISYDSVQAIEVVGHQVNDNWDEEIKTFDLAGNQLFNAGVHYVLGNADTKVQANFEWVGAGPAPNIGDLVIIIRLEPFENGGRYVSTRISSARVKGLPSQFKSIDASNKVVLTNPSGNIFRGEALIDFTKLAVGVNYDITARIYNLTNMLTGNEKLTTSGAFKLMTDGNNKLKT